MGECLQLDGYQIAREIGSRSLSAVGVTQGALDRIDERDRSINSFTVLTRTVALNLAQEVDRLVASEGERALIAHPLLGIPISIKDHIWLKGVPATNGSRALADFVPLEDSVCVSRLKAAGAIVVGKTNNPEFCYRGYTDNLLYGTTRNPWNRDRTSGGSSGGAAASVSGGMVPIGIGTDAGGSIRIPASFCGLVGHKPTFGLVPKEPGFRGWKSLSVDGPLTRSVRDAALVLSVIAGMAPADDLSYPATKDYLRAATEEHDLSKLRIAYSTDLGFAPVESDVRKRFALALEKFRSLGCDLVEAHPEPQYPTDMWNLIALCEGYASEGHLLAEWEDQMSPGTAELIRAGEGVPASRYLGALHDRASYARLWAEFFQEFDLLLTPTMQLTAFEVGLQGPSQIDGRPVDQFFDDWCLLSYPANLTGQPAMTVPMGLGDDGLPVGLQIMGRRFDDDLVIAAGAAFERVSPWIQTAPLWEA